MIGSLQCYVKAGVCQGSSVSGQECVTGGVCHCRSVSLEECATGGVCHWRIVSLEECVTGRVCHWRSVSLEERVTGGVCHTMIDSRSLGDVTAQYTSSTGCRQWVITGIWKLIEFFVYISKFIILVFPNDFITEWGILMWRQQCLNI